MKGDILLFVGNLGKDVYRRMGKLPEELEGSGIERVVLIDLPDGEAYLGDMAEEKLQEFHELIHNILE